MTVDLFIGVCLSADTPLPVRQDRSTLPTGVDVGVRRATRSRSIRAAFTYAAIWLGRFRTSLIHARGHAIRKMHSFCLQSCAVDRRCRVKRKVATEAKTHTYGTRRRASRNWSVRLVTECARNTQNRTSLSGATCSENLRMFRSANNGSTCCACNVFCERVEDEPATRATCSARCYLERVAARSEAAMAQHGSAGRAASDGSDPCIAVRQMGARRHAGKTRVGLGAGEAGECEKRKANRIAQSQERVNGPDEVGFL